MFSRLCLFFLVLTLTSSFGWAEDQMLVFDSDEIDLEDVWVYEYSWQNWNNANFGEYASLSISSNVDGIVGTRGRSYVKFDITKIGVSPDLPLSVEAIRKVELVLSVVPQQGPVYAEVHRVLTAWEEGDGVYHSGETEPSAPAGVVSWNNQPSWDSVVVSKTDLPSSANEYSIQMDVTELVKAWMRGTYANYGLVLVGEDEGSASYKFIFRASEYSEADFRPKLLVTYSTEATDRIADPLTGHEYQICETAMTWLEAKAHCENLGGHLATMNTAEENELVFQNLVQPANHYCWLGASNDNAEGVWKWVTGEPWLYVNWSGGEPNNYCGDEHYLHIFKNQSDAWNDQSNDGSCASYGLMYPLCEWPHGSGDLVPDNGIWRSSDGLISFYLQKYQAGSCILVVTTGDGIYTAFMDFDYTDGVSCSDDLMFQGHTLQLNLSQTNAGIMTVSLPGTGTITRAASLLFPDTRGSSPDPKNGIWKSSDGAVSFYFQVYEAGSCILVATTGDGNYTAFLDPTYADGIQTTNDLDNGGYAVDFAATDGEHGTLTISLPGFGSNIQSVELLFPDVP